MTEAFIYVIASSELGPVKIGTSKQPERRLKQLQTGHSDTLAIFHREAIAPDQALLMERAIHAENRLRKRSGEWFNMTVEDAILEVRHAMIRFEEEVGRAARTKAFVR